VERLPERRSIESAQVVVSGMPLLEVACALFHFQGSGTVC
jgi:hypothetical protein